MSTVLSKKQMTEEDIKLNYITPAILKGWKGHITMETKITDGRINIRGNIVARSKPKFADYLLYLNDGKPIAVVEAKDNNHSVSHGLQQAMSYALMMDLPFAYSSNGDAFYEHNFLTGQEQQIALDKFPTQDELVARYYAELNGGKGISDLEKKIVSQPYYSSQNTYPPRYYQRNAVNRTVEAIARGQQRLLLVMATGTGKTYTAFQIVYRLLRSDIKKRILYLADRNILVDQSIAQDFAPLEKTIYKVDFSDKECLREIASHEVNFALYHQMVGQNDEEHFRQIPPEYFDLIVVDECHRGSAKEDSNWRKVLEYFSSATQIGMTATPKESEKVSNIDYFGEPVYIYSLKQGIEDGFLAPFKVINITTNIGDGWRPYHGQTDIYGNVIEDRIYNNRDYDYNIILQDRIDEVAREITEYLKSTDRMQKTIVFCASEDHAERMRIALVNHNSDMVKENPDYCVRITGSDVYGKSKLDYFISVSEPYPVIATTSELLSTGADCKMTKLIVLDSLIPLPPLAEQKRIVAKIEELLPYVDRYAEAYEKLEQFNAKFPEDMKKSILQYAIQGKLVEQRPEEGTAEELYQQIQAEKQRLIAEKKIKKEKLLAEITEDEIPFDIPESWKWVRLSDIIDVRDGTHDSPKYVPMGIPLVTSKNLSNGTIDYGNVKYITQEDADTDLEFAPFTCDCNPASNLWIAHFDVTGSMFKCFMLDKPSTQGFSGGPVISFKSPDTPMCYGLIHGTRQDNTGGKLAIVVHSAYLFELLEYAKNAGQ